MHWQVWYWVTVFFPFTGEARALGGDGIGGRDKIGLDTLNNDPKHDLRLTLHQLFNSDDDNDINLNPYENIAMESHFYDLDSFIANFKHNNKPFFININVQSLLSKHEN